MKPADAPLNNRASLFKQTEPPQSAFLIFHDRQPAIRPNFSTEETPTLAKMQWANQTVFYENSIVLIDVYFPAHIFDIHPLARLPVIVNFSGHSRALKPTQILRRRPQDART